jgi:glycyl-tRNA synthetase
VSEDRKPLVMSIGDAVKQRIVANETLGYFIARTYLFLLKLGVDEPRLRFRQHLEKEMAHYAEDCWDAEIQCSYGWIECVGMADRAAFDLNAHASKSKVDLTAYEKYPEPRQEEARINARPLRTAAALQSLPLCCSSADGWCC